MKVQISTVVGLLVVAMSAPPGLAQSGGGLSDIAGSIEIEKPESGEVMISDRDLKRPFSAGSMSGTSFGKCIDVRLTYLDDALTGMRSMVSTYDALDHPSDFRRFHNICNNVVEISSSFKECKPDKAWMTQPNQDLLAAVGDCAEAARHLGTPGRTTARSLVVETNRLLDDVVPPTIRAIDQLRAAIPPAPVKKESSHARVLRQIDEYCSERWGPESAGRRRCFDEQSRSHYAIFYRDHDSAGLSSAVFFAIRAECLTQWDEDFVRRDECERRRIAQRRPR